ncbi:MAG: alpha/beta hydrolase [Spirochaetia bacterium]
MNFVIFKKIGRGILCGFIIFLIVACTQVNKPRYFTFELNPDVKRESVTYKNRYGITLAADLYTPKDLNKNQQYPAIVVGPPFGGVKEQGPGVYANQLAQRGYVVLAFDPSYKGESGGSPRDVSSPDIFAEDFSAGVDYLGTRPFVNREKIGAIGICGSGGFALSAAQVDTRIKAVATAAMYDISRSEWAASGTTRAQVLERLSQQRWIDFEKGQPEYLSFFPKTPDATLPDGLDPITAEFYGYYGMARGHHPNAQGGSTTTSRLAWTNFQLLNHIASISPRPVLFITGENAHSRFYSDMAYAEAASPKELYVVPASNHVDLYDDTNKIPFHKLVDFFNQAFNR